MKYYLSIILVVNGFCAICQSQKLYFGFTDGNFSNPFIGYYSNGSFTKLIPPKTSPEVWTGWSEHFAANLPLDTNLPGLDNHGIQRTIIIKSINKLEGDLYESLYTVPMPDTDFLRYTLFHSPGLSIEYYQHDSITNFSESDIIKWKSISMSHLKQALEEKDPQDRADSVWLGQPKGLSLKDSGYPRIITIPFYMKNKIRTDDRGLITLFWDVKKKKTIKVYIGHPEWEPLNKSIVKTFKPLFFFKIKGDQKIYILADYQGYWEDLTYAIADAQTGESLITTY